MFKKRIFHRITLLILISLLPVFVSGCRQQAFPSAQAETYEALPSDVRTASTTVRANLHLAPSGSSDSILQTIPAGTALTIGTSTGDWTRVYYHNQIGYLYTAFLVEDSSEQSASTGSSTPSTNTVVSEDVSPSYDPTQFAAASTYADGTIHGLTSEELEHIRSNYDSTVEGYGAFRSYNELNQSQHALNLQQMLSEFSPLIFGTIDTAAPTIYLSFPLGYEYEDNTTQVLDLLKEKGVSAVFYVTHEYAGNNTSLIQRMIDEGHQIGNHSYAHPSNGLPSLSLEEQMIDTISMQQYMRDSFGYTMTKYNFNSSYWSYQSAALIVSMGYQLCFYSFNYADYDAAAAPDRETALAYMTEALTPGCIYYLHTTSDGNVEALADFIDYARNQGYRFGIL